jgi:hypothetical protein
MNPKALLVPIAAFAVTVTGVQAFNSDLLQRAGLSEEQIAAFEVAQELRQEGDKDAARDVLLEAGIDLETMKSVRQAMHEHRHEMHQAITDAVEANDFAAFKVAVEGSPLADIVTTEADFALFKEAHELRAEGEHDEAKEIMTELGFDEFHHKFGSHRGPGFGHGKEIKSSE